jgi:hypothetical protein
LPGGRVELPGLGRQVNAVEPEGVLPDSLIAPGQYIFEDARNRPAGLRIGPGNAGQKRLQGVEGRHRQPANQETPSLGRRLATRL